MDEICREISRTAGSFGRAVKVCCRDVLAVQLRVVVSLLNRRTVGWCISV